MAKKVTVQLQTVGADSAVKDIEKVNGSLDKLNTNQKQTTKSSEALTTRVSENGGAMGLLNQLTGGMAQTFKDAGEAVGLTSKSLKGLKGAILATGIGILVIGLSALIANFREVKIFLGIINPQQERFNEVMEEANVAAVDAARGLETLRDIVLDTSRSEEVRNEALRQLSGTVTELNGLTIDSAGALDQVTASTGPYITATMARAKADAFAKIVAEEEAKLVKARIANESELSELFQRRFDLEAGDIYGKEKKLRGTNAQIEKLTNSYGEQEAIISGLKDVFQDLTAEALEAEAALNSTEKKVKKTGSSAETTEQKAAKMARALEEIRKGTIIGPQEERDEQVNQINAHYDKLLENAKLYLEEDSEVFVQLTTARDKKISDLRQKFADEDAAAAEAERQNELQKKREANALENADEVARRERLLAAKQFDLSLEEDPMKKIEIQKEILALEQELLLERLNFELSLTDENTQANIDAKNAILAANEKFARANKKLTDDTTKTETAITKKGAKEREEAIQQAFQNITSLVGASSKFGKGIAAGNAIRDTLAGANKALAQGGIFGFIQAAAIIASGFKNVKSILATEDPAPPAELGASTPAGGAEPTVPPTPEAQSLPPAFTTVGASGINQIADVLGESKPQRAFVVSGDVSTAQELDRNIVQSASLG
jgi:hypothetical protein